MAIRALTTQPPVSNELGPGLDSRFVTCRAGQVPVGLSEPETGVPVVMEEEIVESEMANGVVVQADKDERGISALVSSMDEGKQTVTMILVVVDPL